jgi:hypothetical protein
LDFEYFEIFGTIDALILSFFKYLKLASITKIKYSPPAIQKKREKGKKTIAMI